MRTSLSDVPALPRAETKLAEFMQVPALTSLASRVL